MYCAEYQRSQGTMDAICKTQCKSCYNTENSVIKNYFTTEKKDALLLIKIFRSEIEMESGHFYDPTDSEDLDRLALHVSIKHVKLVLKTKESNKSYWLKVLNELELILYKK